MHPEPWPAAQHLPVIALAIVLCAALVTASLIGARLRLGQVREADTRQAQVDHLTSRGLSHAVRLTSVESSVTASSAAITSLTARAAEIEARLDMLSASIKADGLVGITLKGSGTIPGSLRFDPDARLTPLDCTCGRRSCSVCSLDDPSAAKA